MINPEELVPKYIVEDLIRFWNDEGFVFNNAIYYSILAYYGLGT
jgi:hypothetical protein